MAPDDRDRNFEKALARHLRSGLPSADTNASVNARNESCPDPETLASYHERSLSLHELNSWKQHIASCERCQLVLAHLETTEDIPLGVETGKNVVVMGAPAAAHSHVYASRATVDEGATAPASPGRLVQKAAVSAAASKTVPRPAPWRWLVPAGALAAGLLVWITYRESQPPRLTAPSTVEEAQNRQPSPPPQPALTSPSNKPDKDQRTRSSEPLSSMRRDANAPAPQNQTQKHLDKETVSELTARNEPAPQQNEKEEKAKHAAVPKLQTGDHAKTAAVDESSRQKQNERQDQGAAPQSPPVSSQPAFVANESSNAIEPAPAAPSPKSQDVTVESRAQSEVVGGAISASADKKSSSKQALRSMRLVKTEDLRLFGPAGGKVLWRAGPAGLIEISSDNGATWTAQTSGVTSDLFAGSAPSEKVCWIVGSVGMILRTEDGGAHWVQVASPASGDFRKIDATDALHATLWDATGKEGFQTADGGATWTRLSDK